MSNRLQELLRQKALLSEQLDWLEKEIYAEQARAAGTGMPLPATSPPAAPVPPAGPSQSSAGDETEAEAILDQYRRDSQETHRDTRREFYRGCLVYLAAGIALLCLGYFTLRLLGPALNRLLGL